MLYHTTYIGTSRVGGENGTGSIFKIDDDGTTNLLHSIGTYGPVVPVDNGFVKGPDGVLYAMTSAGGATGVGAILSVDPTTDDVQFVASLSSSTGGHQPVGDFLLTSDDRLVGSSYSMFEFDPATSLVSKITSTSNSPRGTPVEAPSGLIYSMTYNRGSNNQGSIFSYDPVTTIVTDVYSFETTTGTNPVGDLTYLNGFLYGFTQQGGANSRGVVFKFEIATGTYTVLADLSTDYLPYSPTYGSFTITESNNLIAGSRYGGGTGSYGVIFGINTTTDEVDTLKTFKAVANGNQPVANLAKVPGQDIYYGTTVYGGTNNDGVIYKLDLADSSVTVIHNFERATSGGQAGRIMLDGNILYGMTRYGGSSDLGVVYKYDLSGSTFTKLADLDGSANGRLPGSHLTKADNGRVYGAMYGGGYFSQGLIFSVDENGEDFQVEKSIFDEIGEGSPEGAMVFADDTLYMTTSYSIGALVGYNVATQEMKTLFEFTNTEGRGYNGVAFNADSTFLYGRNQSFGANNLGTIFKYEIATGEVSVVYDFQTADGDLGDGVPFLASDGNFYGINYRGGANSRGTIYRLDPSTDTFTKLYDFAADMGYSQRAFVEGKPGHLYATTDNGGTGDVGTIFEYNIETNEVTILMSADDHNLRSSQSDVTLSADSTRLITSFRQDGANNYGAVVSYSLLDSTVTVLHDFDLTVGGGLQSTLAVLSATDYIDFPDENFENALLNHDPVIDANSDGRIQLSEAANVSELDVSNQNISNLAGIEYFENITSLLAYYNSLTEVDLSSNGALEILNLSVNDLSSLDVSRNTSLTSLRIGGNDLSELNVSQNTDLTDLIISDCPIASLDLSANVDLVSFTATNNQLSSIDLSASSGLLSVSIYDQPDITSINLRNTNNENFTVIRLDGNTSLTCVSVDNPAYSKENWSQIDDNSVFKFSCDADEVVNIPDANFKAALLANTNLNTIDDGEITVGEAEAYTGAIVATSAGIVDISGIEYFPNIITLTLLSNSITSVDLTYNPALTFLSLSANELDELDVSQNVNLTGLYANDNNLTSLDISANTQLTNLLISDNAISSIDLSNQVDLERFIANNTTITSLDLSVNSSLNELSVTGTPVTSIDLRNGAQATLSTIDLTGNTSLTCVSVDDPIYAKNNWTNVDDPAVFKFTCDPNDAVNIPDENFEAALLGNASINTVDDGKITYAEAEVVNNLQLASLSIDDLTGIQAFAALVTLSAQSNNLTEVDLRYNADLDNLNLSSNPITSIDLSANTGLLDVRLSNTSLTSINLDGLVDITLLTLSGATIGEIDVTALANLDHLNVLRTGISTLDLSSNTELTYLNAGTNSLTSLDLSANTQLRTVYVGENMITDLNLSMLPDLQNLSVEDNGMMSLNIKTGNNTNMIVVNLAENPDLTCITVDDVDYAATNFTDRDESANFSTDCSNLETDVLTFSISEEVEASSIDLGAHQINVLVPVATDLSTLVPSFTLSSGATASIESGEAADFSSSFIMTVTAENPTIEQDWEVIVLEENVVPTAIELTSTSIAEGNAIGELVCELSSEDANVKSTFTYSIVAGDGDTDNASFSISGNQLKAAEVFDFETKSSYSVRVQTDDGRGGVYAEAFTITITDTNESIVVENPLADQSVDEDFASLRVDFSNVFVDGDGDDLTFEITSSNESVVTVSLDGFEVIVTEVGNGVSNITLTANDGSDITTSDVFVVTVNNVNDAPEVAATLSDVTVDEYFASTTVDVSNTFTDEDGDDLTLTAASSDESVVTVSIADGTLTITETGLGESTITVTATDPSGAEGTTTFVVTVNNVNDAPEVANAVADLTLDEYFASSGVSLTDVFTDKDGETLTLSASNADDQVITIEIVDGVLVITEIGLGSSVVTLTAEDASGETATTSFTVTVNNVNDAPTVANPIADQETEEGFATMQIGTSDVFADLDGDDLTLSVTSSDETVVTLAFANDQLTITEVGLGVSTITVTAEDGNGGSVSDEFTFTVTEIPNGIPVVANAIDDEELEEGFGTRNVSFTGVFTDPDGDALTVSVVSSDANVVTVAIANDEIVITEVGVGVSTITVTAEDGNGGSVSHEFTFTVTAAPNNAPIVEAGFDDVSEEEGFESIKVSYTKKFSDPDGDALTISVEVKDERVVTAGLLPEEGMILIKEQGIGETVIKVTATDPDGASVSSEFSVVVSGGRQPLGLEDQLSLEIYPNPVTNFINIESESEVGVKVINLNGQELQSDYGRKMKLNMEDLASGVYLIQIQRGDEIIRKRIIKN